MRLLFLGDVVGRAGRDAVLAGLPRLRADYGLDFVAINGENAAGGFGITERICHNLLDAGADVVTTGNHAFDQREAMVFITRQGALLRPVNFPKGAPGQGAGLYEARNGARVLVINAMGRVFMDAMDDPFSAVEAALAETRLGEAADAIVIDMHAEATSEKQAMGHYLDGRVSLVAGTHTHVPTADHQILEHGTAYISDLGMCGDYNSVLGFNKSGPLNRFLTKLPGERFSPALGEATLSGIAVEIDDKTGLATALAPLRLGGRLSPALPEFWD